jgi:3-hydroxyacyl-CoA dehydrogenase
MGPVRSVGVVGAGVMGSEVAQMLAQSAFDVVLVDVSKDVLEQARDIINKICVSSSSLVLARPQHAEPRC